MLAVGYLALLLLVGDTLAIPLMDKPTRPRRIATAFLVGLVTMSWLTYLGALAFASDPAALDLGNLVALVVGVLVLVTRLVWHVRRGGTLRPAMLLDPPDLAEMLDWAVIGLMTILVTWMMIATLGFAKGELQIGAIVWSDFGPTTAIAQSFALGHNFPTEYPHFAGYPILYHFLFYFQVGNLTHLGFDPALATNALSIASVIAMLVMVMAMGQALFRSASAGRIAALLFFVHGSLSFREYLAGFSSVSDALRAIAARTAFLPSGFPYRGEDWGVWSQLVFLNQRHLASAIGLLFVAILFVLERLPERTGIVAMPTAAKGPGDGAAADAVGTDASPARLGPGERLDMLAVAVQDRMHRPIHHIWAGLVDPRLLGYVTVGLLLGLLPLWNSAVFFASAVVLAVLFLLIPNRPQMMALAIAAGSAALPQLLVLRPGSMPQTTVFPIFHWGYVVDDPTVTNVANYLAFTFGPKLLLAAVALIAATWRQRAVFLAFTGLVATAFLFQFSVEVLANHKLINIWLICLDLFAAVGLLRLWNIGTTRWRSLDWPRQLARLAGRVVAVALVAVIAAGGLIDLAPVWNTHRIGIRLVGDRLVDWLVQHTEPTDVFLTDLYVTHPILLAGRRVYYGWPYYAWSTGYPTAAREKTYREMLGGTSAATVVKLMQQEHIAYVAIDDGLRKGTFLKFLNERLISDSLEQVFSDPEGRNGHIAIYRVPVEPVAADTPTDEVPVDMFTGGQGAGPGQFAAARGIAVTSAGEVLVADADNHRIQHFSSSGAYVGAFGGKGDGPGRFNQPNGVAVDSRGHIFVADTTNHRLQEFDASFHFISEWHGPDPGFYGPRDVFVGHDDVVYVLDQGRGRVVSRARDGTIRSFGSLGKAGGQLLDPTGLTVAGGRVYVADTANARISVFTTEGAFVSSVLVPEWNRPTVQYVDLVVSEDGRSLYASSFATDEVLVLSLDGRRLGALSPTPPDHFEGPGAMALRPGGGLYVVEFQGARISSVITAH